MDWDDLRYVLSIARGGGLAAAARELKVNTSSVYRRLEALEAQLEVRLFERLRSGYRLTEQGEALAETAQRMEVEALAVERLVRGTDLKLEGNIRLSTSEAVAQYLLPPLLAEFRDQYPGVTLAISANNQVVDLTRRDADVVIRVTATPPPHLVGRSVGFIGFASYATPAYLDRAGRGLPLADYEWIGFEGPMLRVRQATWMSERIPESRQMLRFDSFGAASEAVLAGVGCGALPCFASDHDPRLERLPDSYVKTDLQLWVLTHPDLRKSARIRACLQFFGARLNATGARLEGEQREIGVRES
ncbi:MAG: LysR family transcriptional regulator [Panacagrimonas sp.]